MPNYIREKDIEDYLRNRIREIGGKAYKWVSPGNSGVPDRLVFLPNGRIIPIELKAPGREPTQLQLKKHAELKSLGVEVYVIDTKEKVDGFIEYCKECIDKNEIHTS